MADLTVFKNETFGEIRTLEIDKEPWFVGKDVAAALGYGEGKSLANAVAKHVDTEDKGVTEMMTPGGKQQMVIINESGLYSLVLSSKLPTAKQFKRWVTSEVLPAIRKHGIYTLDNMLDDPDALINALQAYKKERQEKLALQQAVAIKDQQILEMQPKVRYYDIILQSASTMPVSQIAKDYGMSAKELNKTLHELGVQYKQGNIWLLYQKYAQFGYTQSKTFTVNDKYDTKLHTYWTQKGRLFLYDLLKNNGILPLIERE